LNIPSSHRRTFLPMCRSRLTVTLFLIFSLLSVSSASAAKVLIVGDTQYAMVADVVSEIQSTLRTYCKDYATSEVRGRLGSIVEREEAQVVVALGTEAIGEALRLPPGIPVVYGLVVVPPKSGRSNVTGVYMSPPVSEYSALVRRYLPGLGKFTVVGSPHMMKNLLGSEAGRIAAYNVNSPADLVNTINRLADARALLLLPDANLLTGQVLSNVLLYSFRKNIPLIGVSEVSVKQGSLFALVFDTKTICRQIGEMVQAILNGADAEDIPPSPPKKYNLYVNSNTAHKMGIDLPDEMVRKAKKVYE